MKRILYSCFLFLALFFNGTAYSQAFWTETFGATSCGQANVATIGVPTASNGAWAITLTGANDPDANQWFISATEHGNAVGSCGTGCTSGNNRTLHIGNVSTSPAAAFVCPTGDCGAAYDAGFGLGDVASDRRVESPVINCTGKVNITLSFKYMLEGDPGNDFAELFYFNGATWSNLGLMAPTANAACAGQGLWTAFSVALPASANNNPNVRVGFHWVNNDDGLGTDPSVAIDDVVLSTLSAVTITTSATACTNQTVTGSITTPTIAGATYTWVSSPAGVVFAPTTGTSTAITYPSAGTYSIVVVELNPLPTASSNTVVVTVSAGPTVNVTPPSQSICTGSSATLTANATAGSTFQWFNGATPLGTASTQVVSPGTTTSYSVVATIGSCTAAASTTVTVGSSLAISAGPSSPSVCPGSAVTLTASGGTTYTWVAPPSNTLSTTSTAVDNPTVATTYTVYVTSGTCNGNLTINVGMSTGLTLTVAASSSTVCPGQTTTLTASGALNYTWSPGSSLSTTSGSVTNASPLTQTTYTVVGDNGAGCTGTAQITISMGAGASIGVSSTASAVCTGFTSTLSATGATSYTWTGTTFTTAIVQPSISVGPGTYTVLGSTGAGCNSFSVVTINLAPPLNIQVTQSSFTTCVATNFPMQFSKPVTLNATGASIYSWAQCNPLYMTICIGPTVTVRPPTSTCYTVTGSTAVCSGSQAVCVTVIPQFTMQVTPQQPIICIGDSILLKTTAIGTLAALPIPATSFSTNGYVWTEPLNAPPPSLSAPLSGTTMAYPLTSCTYTYEIYDARQCVSLPRLITVTVLPKPITSIAIPTINNVATNTVCFVGLSPGAPDNTLTLTGNNQNVGLPFGVVPTYTWVSPYLQAPCNSQSILSPANNNSIIVNAPCRLPQVVTYSLISGYNGIPGCRRDDTVSVRAIDCRPVRNIFFETATPNDTICSRTCVTFLNHTDTMAGGPQQYKWQFAGGAPATSTLNNPTVCYNLPGVYNVVLTVSNPYALATGGSTLVAYRQNYIKVVDIPNVTIIPPGQQVSDTIIRFGECVQLTASGAKSYVWRENYFISSLTAHNVTVCPQQTNLYIVRGYNSSQCASEDSINVIVVDDCGEMFVPNAFSPNNDGANDVLYVRGHCLETLTFMVFNRWGQKVFETTDKTIGWDGTFNGDMMNSGVFVYRLEGKDYEGKGYSLKGNVTLIR